MASGMLINISQVVSLQRAYLSPKCAWSGLRSLCSLGTHSLLSCGDTCMHAPLRRGLDPSLLSGHGTGSPLCRVLGNALGPRSIPLIKIH